MEWINLNDKLPEEEKYVLFFGKGERFFSGLYRENNFLAINPFCDYLEIADEVTHWMILPEPPKK